MVIKNCKAPQKRKALNKKSIIIIGGGISGLGVGLAAARSGQRPVILEAREIASATSDNTLRIIHGGFRYLQKFDLPRVFRSLGDQTSVATDYSQYVKPLACLMPLTRFGLKSRIPVSVAAILYGATMRAARSKLNPPRVLNSKELLAELSPTLSDYAPNGALCWHDLVMTDPQGLAKCAATEITTKGGEIRESTMVTRIERGAHGFVVTTSTGQSLLAERVVNTLGPWLSSVEIPESLRGTRPDWCIGFNVTINRLIDPTYATATQSDDGRLFFAVPRGEFTTIGTWYYPCSSPHLDSPQKPQVMESEIQRFINSWNRSWPSQRIVMADIKAIDSGILPMRRDSPSGPILYGAEIIHRSSDRCYIEVLSTKYTSFRSVGLRVVG